VGGDMSISIERFKHLFPKQAAEMTLTSPAIIEKKSKYNNVKTEADGITFDSKKEAKYYADLALLQKSGEVISIFPQPEFELQPAYVKDGKKVRPIKYIADFLIEYKDGRKEVVDVKGYKKNKVYRLKKKMFHNKFPNLTIIEI
jgi:hypothetical protein